MAGESLEGGGILEVADGSLGGGGFWWRPAGVWGRQVSWRRPLMAHREATSWRPDSEASVLVVGKGGCGGGESAGGGEELLPLAGSTAREERMSARAEGGVGTEHGSCFPNRGPLITFQIIVVGGNRMRTCVHVGGRCDLFDGFMKRFLLKRDAVAETSRP